MLRVTANATRPPRTFVSPIGTSPPHHDFHRPPQVTMLLAIPAVVVVVLLATCAAQRLVPRDQAILNQEFYLQHIDKFKVLYLSIQHFATAPHYQQHTYILPCGRLTTQPPNRQVLYPGLSILSSIGTVVEMKFPGKTISKGELVTSWLGRPNMRPHTPIPYSPHTYPVIALCSP